MSSKFESAPEFTQYSETPVFRRRWFWMLSFMLFIPAAVAIALSGPVYASQKGEVVQFTRRHRLMTAAGFTLILVMNVARLMGGN